MKNNTPKLILAAGLTLAMATAAQAVVSVGNFYSINGGTLNNTDVDAVGVNFTASGSTAYDGALAQFNAPVTLADGDSISLSFNVEAITSNNNQTWSFRYGLFNTGGNPVTANDQATISDDWTGYFAVRHTTTSNLSNENGGGSDLIANGIFQQAAGTANLIAEGVGGGFSNFPSANGVAQLTTRADGDDAIGGNDGSDGTFATDNLPIAVNLTILRSGSSLVITTTPRFSNTNTGSFTFTDTTAETFTFDALAFGSISNFRVDDVLVSATAIPEPSTYALLGGLAALGLVMVRRRRR